jgi:hypothetical protein
MRERRGGKHHGVSVPDSDTPRGSARFGVPLHCGGIFARAGYRSNPIFGITGAFARLTANSSTGSSSKIAPEHSRRELAHRSKNLLAIVQSIVQQSKVRLTSVEDYADRLADRIHQMVLERLTAQALNGRTTWSDQPNGTMWEFVCPLGECGAARLIMRVRRPERRSRPF